MTSSFRCLAVLLSVALFARPALAVPQGTAPQYVPPPSPVTQRAPTPSDDSTAGFAIGNLWLSNGDLYQAQRVTAGKAAWAKAPPSALPCDVAACAVAYGTKKLRAAYAGSALVVTRTSDSTTKAIGFLPSGLMDVASGDAFCAGLAATACVVTTWYDESGNGYDATAPVATAPLWSAAASVAGTRAVSFASVVHGLGSNQPAVARFMSVPSGFAWTPNASTWFFAGQQMRSQENAVIAESTTHVGFLANYVQSAAIKLVLEGGAGSCPVPTEIGPAVIGIDWNGGSITCSVNNATGSAGTGGASAVTGAYLGGSGGSSNMDEVAMIAYASALPSATFAAVKASLHGLFGIAPQANDIVLFDGDSTTSGAGSILDNTHPRLALPLLSRPVRAFNTAVFGYSLATALARLPYTLGSVYSPGARTVVVHILAGANDIRANASAATVYANLQSYVAAAKAYGPNVRVVVATEPVQCDIFNNANWLPVLQSYNSMIQAGWSLPQSAGGLGADGLADYQQDPTIGPASYASSGFCSGTIAPDGQHPYDATMAYLAQVEAAAINAVLR